MEKANQSGPSNKQDHGNKSQPLASKQSVHKKPKKGMKNLVVFY